MASSLHSKKFPLSLLKTKGQLFDVEALFKSTRYGKAIPDDTPTLQAQALGAGKTSFENAATVFLLGLGTEQGLLPNMDEQAFEPDLIEAVLDLKNDDYSIECNHTIDGKNKLSKVVTQATDILLYGNILCN